MLTIGFTTGFLYDPSLLCGEQEKNISVETIKKCKILKCNAVELNCIGGFYDSSLQDLLSLEKYDLRRFDHVSIHAPCRNARFGNDIKTQYVLQILKKAVRDLNIDLIVFHPDTIDDWTIFKNFEVPIAIENLDNRKSHFRSVSDLKKIFDILPWCKFVLDLNHCKSNDPTMRLAREFIDAFGDRLVEIHISGYQNYHYPLYRTGQVEILNAVHDSGIPMIIESICQNMEDARMEMDYIQEYFNKK